MQAFCGEMCATSLGSISSSGTWQTNMGAAGPYVQILFSNWLTRTFDPSWSGWPTKSESSTLKTYMSNFRWLENCKQQERTFRHLQLVTTLDGLRIIGNVPQSARRLKASPRNRERQMDTWLQWNAVNISVLLSLLIPQDPWDWYIYLHLPYKIN